MSDQNASTELAVQATGAMAIVVADVGTVHDAADPARALFTLSIMTGVVMIVAGLLKLGSILRFVSNAVMVGFINAVGVNIVLGQPGPTRACWPERIARWSPRSSPHRPSTRTTPTSPRDPSGSAAS